MRTLDNFIALCGWGAGGGEEGGRQTTTDELRSWVKNELKEHEENEQRRQRQVVELLSRVWRVEIGISSLPI